MSRDTQFANFAKMLLEEIDKATDDFCKDKDNKNTDEYEEQIVTLVARRAYDLACHAVNHVSESKAAQMEVNLMSAEDVVGEIPDMTELPED